MNDISDAELEEFVMAILGSLNDMARELELAANVLRAAIAVTPQPESEFIRVPAVAMTRFGDRCDAFATTAFKRITEAGAKLGVTI